MQFTTNSSSREEINHQNPKRLYLLIFNTFGPEPQHAVLGEQQEWYKTYLLNLTSVHFLIYFDVIELSQP